MVMMNGGVEGREGAGNIHPSSKHVSLSSLFVCLCTCPPFLFDCPPACASPYMFEIVYLSADTHLAPLCASLPVFLIV